MTTFDRLFAEAAPLIELGRHEQERPPVGGGRRPLSVVLHPDRACSERLEQVMTQVERLAGPGHLRTGIAGSVHFTVRVLERYREAVGEQDEAAGRYARAMRRAAGRVDAIELDLVGLTGDAGSGCRAGNQWNKLDGEELVFERAAGQIWWEARKCRA